MSNTFHDQLSGPDLHDNKVYPATETPLPSWSQTDARYQAKGSIAGLPAATTTQNGIVTNSDWTSFTNKGYRSAYVVGPSGSVGNDYTGNGTADDVALNAAIQSGRTVYIKDGTYNLTRRINLNGKQNIRIIGESKAVIFQIPQASLTNFGFSYMIGGNATSSDIYIEGLYLYGGYSNYTNPDTNSGGGINPGKRWVIYNCTFEDFTYFPVFIGTDTSDSKIINCRWIGPGHGGDSIGGGGGNNIEVYGGIWEANVNGSAFDNTSGTHYSIHHGMIKGLSHIYLEAMQHVEVHHMTHLGGGGIYALSDVGYGPTSILNSQDIQIRNNRISGGGGISYKADGAPGKSATLGGQVQIIGNTVVAPDTTGVHLLGYSDPTVWGNGYIVAENTVINANNTNVSSLNTGYGVLKPSGINIDQLQDIVVANNTCIDARVSPQQFYGIQVGQTFGPSSSNQPNRVTLSGNRIFGYQAAKTNLVSAIYTTDFAELSDDHLSAVGNYGFGTASPAYKYHFSGGILAVDSGSGTDTLRLRDSTITKSAGGFFGVGSGMRLSGPLQTPIAVKTADYAVNQSDSTVFADASGGQVAVTLPSAAGFAGEIFTIKRVSSGANAVVVATTSGQTIDGASTKTLGAQYAAITVQSDSFNWKVIGQLGTVT